MIHSRIVMTTMGGIIPARSGRPLQCWVALHPGARFWRWLKPPTYPPKGSQIHRKLVANWGWKIRITLMTNKFDKQIFRIRRLLHFSAKQEILISQFCSLKGYGLHWIAILLLARAHPSLHPLSCLAIFGCSQHGRNLPQQPGITIYIHPGPLSQILFLVASPIAPLGLQPASDAFRAPTRTSSKCYCCD